MADEAGEDVVLEAKQRMRALELTIDSLSYDLLEARARVEAAERRCAALETSIERTSFDRLQAKHARLRKAMRAAKAMLAHAEREDEEA